MSIKATLQTIDVANINRPSKNIKNSAIVKSLIDAESYAYFVAKSLVFIKLPELDHQRLAEFKVPHGFRFDISVLQSCKKAFHYIATPKDEYTFENIYVSRYGLAMLFTYWYEGMQKQAIWELYDYFNDIIIELEKLNALREENIINYEMRQNIEKLESDLQLINAAYNSRSAELTSLRETATALTSKVEILTELSSEIGKYVRSGTATKDKTALCDRLELMGCDTYEDGTPRELVSRAKKAKSAIKGLEHKTPINENLVLSVLRTKFPVNFGVKGAENNTADLYGWKLATVNSDFKAKSQAFAEFLDGDGIKSITDADISHAEDKLLATCIAMTNEKLKVSYSNEQSGYLWVFDVIENTHVQKILDKFLRYRAYSIDFIFSLFDS